MASHNDFGQLAEEMASDYLIKKGYKILARNFRFQKKELDIIAELGTLIVVVEVKARETNVFIEPHEAVTKAKIKSIVFAADAYLNIHNIDKEVRFDVISILQNDIGNLEVTHIENAFESFDAN